MRNCCYTANLDNLLTVQKKHLRGMLLVPAVGRNGFFRIMVVDIGSDLKRDCEFKMSGSRNTPALP